MDVPLLLSAAAANGGFVTRAQALDCGWLDRDLRAASRSGLLLRLRQGAYVFADQHRLLDRAGRHAVLARAVVHQQRGSVALAGPSAAAIRGLSVYGQDLEAVHIIRLDGTSSRDEAGICHHRLPLGIDEDLEQIGRVWVTTLARTVWDVACMSTLTAGVCTADSALRLHPALGEELLAHAPGYRRRPGSRVARLALSLADGGSESEGESVTRLQCYRHGIPRPTLQYEVFSTSGRLIGRSDFHWPEYRHLGEFDGEVKYQRFLREGESASDAVVREKIREDGMRAQRLGMSRFTWSGVMPANAAATMRQLRRDLEQSRSLYTNGRVVIPL
ncbi:hypothetical protein GCM10009841_29210 [Microlunatus panaciterrae]|uniref:AbiEi antitoxin N-terminal domain-containing protein n=1 Tax=Microlunatus panaciterrae TaxID=400768 RepID=A0ABS2RHA8_9ACTN|nr:type IV toxin-antitoxin system AbiEi family antitoxin domain-containing protein [Microlunatus panaciterrae]MBM7797581.1 hypothetical protein [Microlunatus panaciterrae]